MEAAQARKNTEQLAENMATMQSQLNFLMQLQNGCKCLPVMLVSIYSLPFLL
ncbi:hypothetical protein RHGRI_001836 [Rhododendron griersonianum]|nr:hypothetical protein RHGRI_001836 [Rhododendron griersonianum]